MSIVYLAHRAAWRLALPAPRCLRARLTTLNGTVGDVSRGAMGDTPTAEAQRTLEDSTVCVTR